MSPMFRLTILGFTIGGLVLSASVQAGEPPPPNLAGTVQHAYCMSGYLDYNDPNAYFSRVFEIRVPQNAKPSYPQDLAKIYESYLNQKYGYVRTGPLSVICTLASTAPAVQGGKDILIKDKQHYHRNVVETGWKPSPQEIQSAASGQTAPSASTAPKASSPLTIHAFCKGDQQGKAYFSKLFTSEIRQPSGQPVADQTQPMTEGWKSSFTAFLAQRYGFQGSAVCYAQDQLQPIEWTWGRYHGLALGRSVDTDWSPTT